MVYKYQRLNGFTDVLAITPLPNQIGCFVFSPPNFVPPSPSGTQKETKAKKALNGKIFLQPTEYGPDADLDLTSLFLCLVSPQLAPCSSSPSHLSQQRTAPSANTGVKKKNLPDKVFFKNQQNKQRNPLLSRKAFVVESILLCWWAVG